jgi:hypothetical protein
MSWRGYVTLGNVPAAEDAACEAAFLGFVTKPTWKHSEALVLKSSTQTARIRVAVVVEGRRVGGRCREGRARRRYPGRASRGASAGAPSQDFDEILP